MLTREDLLTLTACKLTEHTQMVDFTLADVCEMVCTSVLDMVPV